MGRSPAAPHASAARRPRSPSSWPTSGSPWTCSAPRASAPICGCGSSWAWKIPATSAWRWGWAPRRTGRPSCWTPPASSTCARSQGLNSPRPARGYLTTTAQVHRLAAHHAHTPARLDPVSAQAAARHPPAHARLGGDQPPRPRAATPTRDRPARPAGRRPGGRRRPRGRSAAGRARQRRPGRSHRHRAASGHRPPADLGR
jgi:hypothetical protein